jgi:ADP-ribose pyrophosphatase
MPRVIAIEIVEDRTATARCDEGFLRVKRYLARNRRADGSVSMEYAVDVIDRATLDAVAVCLFSRTARGVEVLTRSGLRPAPGFRRGRATALPERDVLLLEEVIAGVVEPGEVGLDALRRRAAAEALEEAGISIAPERFEPLGAALFVHPPVSSDRFHLFAAETPRGAMEEVFEAPPLGDGSPHEEGALLRWRRLDDAIAACERGEIEDAKTEVAFRRLAARLAAL